MKAPAARRSLEMLADARLCRLIPHTSANGLPLAAQQNERLLKAALLDVGIADALWNTPAPPSVSPCDTNFSTCRITFAASCGKSCVIFPTDRNERRRAGGHGLRAACCRFRLRSKLHAPKNTTVEGVYRAGKMEQLKVTPESRRKNIIKP